MRHLKIVLAFIILISVTSSVWAFDLLDLRAPFFFLILLIELLFYFVYLVLFLPEKASAKKRRVFLHPYFREAFNANFGGQPVRSYDRPVQRCLVKARRKKLKYPFLCHSSLVERLRFFPLARWYWEWQSDD